MKSVITKFVAAGLVELTASELVNLDKQELLVKSRLGQDFTNLLNNTMNKYYLNVTSQVLSEVSKNASKQSKGSLNKVIDLISDKIKIVEAEMENSIDAISKAAPELDIGLMSDSYEVMTKLISHDYTKKVLDFLGNAFDVFDFVQLINQDIDPKDPNTGIEIVKGWTLWGAGIASEFADNKTLVKFSLFSSSEILSKILSKIAGDIVFCIVSNHSFDGGA